MAKQKFNSGIRWITWSAILLLLTGAGWLVYGWSLNRGTTPVNVKLHTVKKDTVEEKINASGTVELGNQQTLKSPADGIVEQVLVSIDEKNKILRQNIIHNWINCTSIYYYPLSVSGFLGLKDKSGLFLFAMINILI